MRSHFDDFVTARGGVLWRTAWLLTGDGDRAEEMLGRALARIWSPGQGDGSAPGGLDEEALAALVREYLPRRQADVRPAGSADWPANVPADLSAEASPAWTADDGATVQERHELLAALRLLTPRQRAVVVLVHAERRTLPEVAALLGTRTDVVAALHVDACAVLGETPLLTPPGADPVRPPPDPMPGSAPTPPLDAAEQERLRAALATRVPAPPYAPGRAVAAEARARRARRRTMLTAGAAAVAMLAVLVPAVVDGLVPGDPSSGSAAASRRPLVDPLPIPHRCVDVDEEPSVPELDLDLDLASVAWLRFCGAATGESGNGLVGFSPATTVLGDLDPLVASWVARPGLLTCPHRQPVDDGALRLQLGTQDGQTHVVDLVIGRCGLVHVDGVAMAVDGRTVFADALGALGHQLLEERVEGPSEDARPVPGSPRCPVDPMHPDSAGRVTIEDYPPTAGLTMPLPAVGAVVCRYEPRRQPLPRLVESFAVEAAVAEQIRVAYLAQGQSPRVGCDHSGAGPLFAVVLEDGTGSWRSFGFDTGGCDALVGPDFDVGYAGHWLVELVRYAEPACEEEAADAVRLANTPVML